MAPSGLAALFDTGVMGKMRYEVFPTPSVADSVREIVPREMPVTVTTSPTKGLEPTLKLVEELSLDGYHVVPHLSARLVVDEHHLEEIVGRLKEARITELFVAAGDSEEPSGRFESALPLLRQLGKMGRPFEQIGITGYPESHPKIPDDVLVQAMSEKEPYSDYIVSNLCLSQKTLTSWVRRLRQRGIALPLVVGMAGPIEAMKLLSMARKIGVGESSRFARGHLGFLARLGTPGGYDPTGYLEKAGGALTSPPALVTGIHVFTFNQLRRTEKWRRQLAERHAAS